MKNNVYYGKKIHPDYYYQPKYHGFIKYYGETIRVDKYFGCFFTCSSTDFFLPENLKVNFFRSKKLSTVSNKCSENFLNPYMKLT